MLNFRDPQKGNAWNPLTLPYRLWNSGNQDKAIELLDDLALNILYDESNKNADPFWEKTSAGYFAGLALGMFEDAKDHLNQDGKLVIIIQEHHGAKSALKKLGEFFIKIHIIYKKKGFYVIEAQL